MSFLSRWRYPSTSPGRDLRLDLLRGYCVVVMAIDHLGLFPAWTQAITGGARLWVTAAEGFVLIAGIVMGIVYPRLIAKHGWQHALQHVIRRGAGLYAITVVGQIVFNTGDFILRIARNRPTGVPADYGALIEQALFQTRMAPAHLALLPLFVLFMFWGLAVLYGLSRGQWRWVALGSIGLWYAARINPIVFTIVPTPFRFAIWQILFTLGVMAGYYRKPLTEWWRRLPARAWRSVALIGSGLGLLVLSYQVSFNGLWTNIDWLNANSPFFLRTQLGIGRLLAAVWVFAACYELATRCWRPLSRTLGWLFLPLGQHSLTAFVYHALVVYSVQRLPGWPFTDHDPTLMGFIHIGIVLLIWLGTLATVALRRRWPLLHLIRQMKMAVEAK